MKTKLITALTLAGGLLAGSIDSIAQTAAPGSVPPSGSRDVTPPSASTGGKSDGNTSISNNTTVPRPLPPSGTTPPAINGVVPIMLPIDGGGSGTAGNGNTITPGTTPDGRVAPPPGTITLPPGPGAVDAGKVVPPRTVPPASGPGVSLFNGSAQIMPTPTAPNAGGIVLTTGDIPRAVTANVAPAGSPVVMLTQQFAEQRTQELSARAAALEQLRTATPEQRTAIIAELQASQARLASEQREAARELRNELRALREERKGN